MIAKVKLREAVAALPDILEEADAVMVARGDLGVEVGPARSRCSRSRSSSPPSSAGSRRSPRLKMKSMIGRPEPTRAEASDVAQRSSTARRRSCSQGRRSAGTRSRRSRR